MMNIEEEKLRVSLSVAFIATYVALIFGLKGLESSLSNIYIKDLLFSVFFVYGIVVAFFFFIYIVIVATELCIENFKFPFPFDIFFISNTSDSTIKYKRFFFNNGVRLIFISFTVPLFIPIIEITRLLLEK